MPELIRKLESSNHGPWLLDKAALDELDDIILDQVGRLKEHRKTEITAAVRREQYQRRKTDTEDDRDIRKEIESDHPDVTRVITLTLSSGHKIRPDSLREATTDIHCRDEKVTKIEVGLCYGDIRGDLVVPGANMKALTIVTLPEASKPADELFVKLDMWAEQHRPGVLRLMQGMMPPLPMFLAALLIILFTISGLIIGILPKKSDARTEARKLVLKGVKPEDHSLALEILLRQISGLDNEADFSKVPPWYKVMVGVVLSIGALCSFGASTAFDIGKGSVSVRRQKGYAWFLRIAVPSFLIMGVLASLLAARLDALLWQR
jgi:hypothetical protein